MGASKDERKAAAKELKDKTPPPMNTMVEKQSRGDALEKKAARSKMITQNVPPTTPGIVAVCEYCLLASITAAKSSPYFYSASSHYPKKERKAATEM